LLIRRQVKLQRHTAAAIIEQFSHDRIEEVVCNLAERTVTSSARFVACLPAEQEDIVESIINEKEEEH
jgi:hypothetical protein